MRKRRPTTPPGFANGRVATAPAVIARRRGGTAEARVTTRGQNDPHFEFGDATTDHARTGGGTRTENCKTLIVGSIPTVASNISYLKRAIPGLATLSPRSIDAELTRSQAGPRAPRAGRAGRAEGGPGARPLPMSARGSSTQPHLCMATTPRRCVRCSPVATLVTSTRAPQP